MEKNYVIYKYKWFDDVGEYYFSIQKEDEYSDIYHLYLEQDTIRDKLYELSTTYEILDSYAGMEKEHNISVNMLTIKAENNPRPENLFLIK